MRNKCRAAEFYRSYDIKHASQHYMVRERCLTQLKQDRHGCILRAEESSPNSKSHADVDGVSDDEQNLDENLTRRDDPCRGRVHHHPRGDPGMSWCSITN